MQIKQSVLVVSSFVLGIVILCGIFVVGVYWFSWEGYAAERLVNVIPLPAARVNGHTVWLDEYWDEKRAYVHSISQISSYDFATNEGKEFLKQQEENILQNLIERKIVQDIAVNEGVDPSSQDVDQYYKHTITSLAIAQENAISEIQRIFGWSKQEFINHLVVPDMYRQKAAISFMKKNTQSSEYKKALSALHDLNNQEKTFAEAALEYSEDMRTKNVGGVVGFVSKDELQPEFVDQVFSLDVQEISDIIAGPDGYYIFQVLSRDGSQDPGSVQLAQIFIKGPSFVQYVQQELEKHDVTIFVK